MDHSFSLTFAEVPALSLLPSPVLHTHCCPAAVIFRAEGGSSSSRLLYQELLPYSACLTQEASVGDFPLVLHVLSELINYSKEAGFVSSLCRMGRGTQAVAPTSQLRWGKLSRFPVPPYPSEGVPVNTPSSAPCHCPRCAQKKPERREPCKLMAPMGQCWVHKKRLHEETVKAGLKLPMQSENPISIINFLQMISLSEHCLDTGPSFPQVSSDLY